MKLLEEQSVPLIQKIAEGKDLTDSEKQNLEEYARLAEQQNTINDAKQETLKKKQAKYLRNFKIN